MDNITVIISCLCRLVVISFFLLCDVGCCVGIWHYFNVRSKTMILVSNVMVGRKRKDVTDTEKTFYLLAFMVTKSRMPSNTY